MSDGEDDSSDPLSSSSLIKNKAVKNFNAAYFISEISTLILVPVVVHAISELTDYLIMVSFVAIATEWIVDEIFFTLSWWWLMKIDSLWGAFLDSIKIAVRESPT